MKNLIPTLLILLICLNSCTNKTGEKNMENNDSLTIRETDDTVTLKTIGFIERLDEKLDLLIPANAEIEILAEGFTWSEGPVWVESGNFLLFSDVPENKIYKWKTGEGTSVFLEPSGYTGTGNYSSEPGSNGLAIGNDGKLLLCQHGDRRIAKMSGDINAPSSAFITMADNYMGKRLNSPNDMAIYKDGSLYFTDPPYGLPDRENDNSRELDFYGVFRAALDGGETTLLTDKLTRPNGIAFSPDYKICYVNVSDPENAVIMAYNIDEQGGTFKNGRVFYDATPLIPGRKGLPDGLRVHPSGYIFSTGPGGVLILSPEGKLLGTINTTQATANCEFNSDFSYLFMTADFYLLRIPLVN
jgi:gluconolactonase